MLSADGREASVYGHPNYGLPKAVNGLIFLVYFIRLFCTLIDRRVGEALDEIANIHFLFHCFLVDV